MKAAVRVGLLDRIESRVLGSAVVMGSVVVVVVNMVAGLVEGLVVLGGSAYQYLLCCASVLWYITYGR